MAAKPQNKWYTIISKFEDSFVASSIEADTTEYFTFPSVSLNWALRGGIIHGKIATIYGPESGGKTLLALLAIAELHKKDPKAWAIWFDAEMIFDESFVRYVKSLGVDVSRLWIVRDNTPSGIFDFFEKTVLPMVQDEKDPFPLKLAVIDSVKSIRSPKEMNTTSVEDALYSDLPQVIARGFKLLIKHLRRHKISLLAIQQVTEEMDAVRKRMHIKWVVPGGRALKHFSDYMILVEKMEGASSKIQDANLKTIQDKAIQVGHTVRCKVEKNRCGAPYLVAEFKLRYGVGLVDPAWEVGSLGLALGVVTKPTNVSYEFCGVKAKGEDAFFDKLREDEVLRNMLVEAINAVDIYAIKRDAASSTGIADLEEKAEVLDAKDEEV
jgi:recombination protein RecA